MTTIREFTYDGCLSKMLVFAGHPNLVFFFSFLNQEWVQYLAPASARLDAYLYLPEDAVQPMER
jgi:hypothetical protein